MSGPIFFNEPKARAHLTTKGSVYTLRKPRGEGTVRARCGSYYRFDDLGSVTVELVEPNASGEFLLPLVPQSGFVTLSDWRSAADPCATHLYRVSFRPGVRT